jgi:hypothetical protein
MTARIEVATDGAPLRRAKAAMIMLHGRGALAESMLSLAEVFAQPDIAYLAPQAPGGSWYPHSFLAPISPDKGSTRSGWCCSASRRADVLGSSSRPAMRSAMAQSSA